MNILLSKTINISKIFTQFYDLGQILYQPVFLSKCKFNISHVKITLTGRTQMIQKLTQTIGTIRWAV